jgi:hypothetical protein
VPWGKKNGKGGKLVLKDYALGKNSYYSIEASSKKVVAVPWQNRLCRLAPPEADSSVKSEIAESERANRQTGPTG